MFMPINFDSKISKTKNNTSKFYIKEAECKIL